MSGPRALRSPERASTSGRSRVVQRSALIILPLIILLRSLSVVPYWFNCSALSVTQVPGFRLHPSSVLIILPKWFSALSVGSVRRMQFFATFLTAEASAKEVAIFCSIGCYTAIFCRSTPCQFWHCIRRSRLPCHSLQTAGQPLPAQNVSAGLCAPGCTRGERFDVRANTVVDLRRALHYRGARCICMRVCPRECDERRKGAAVVCTRNARRIGSQHQHTIITRPSHQPPTTRPPQHSPPQFR